MIPSSLIKIDVQCANAMKFKSDVLALKYAQRLYGLDRQIASYLNIHGRKIENDLPTPGDFRIFKSPAGIASSRILFFGTRRLSEFDYKSIREFGTELLKSLKDACPDVHHLSLTIHGPGYGLDEIESFESQLAGIIDAITTENIPKSLDRITFVERDERRAPLLQGVLHGFLRDGYVHKDPKAHFQSLEPSASVKYKEVGYTSENKPHIFVAMPFKEDTEDLWDYGIRPVVKAAGFICERADLSSFTGDVMAWVRKRIKSSTLVIADLTGANPNVYLEVGYAWGAGIPTVLVVRNTEELMFDVKGQRCLKYSRIKELEKSLANELMNLKDIIDTDVW